MNIDYRPNSRRNVKISAIQEHGGEYIDIANLNTAHRWFYNHYNVSIRLLGIGTTLNVRRHLKRVHGIKIGRTKAQEESEQEEETISTEEPNLSLISSYLNKVDVEQFRILLIRWLMQCQIPFSTVQRKQFMDLLLCLSPSLKPYLISSLITIGSQVKDEYLKAYLLMKSILANSHLRIYLSFNIQTSPSTSALISIYIYFLGKGLYLYHPLIAIREIFGYYDGEVITEVIKVVISHQDLTSL